MSKLSSKNKTPVPTPAVPPRQKGSPGDQAGTRKASGKATRKPGGQPVTGALVAPPSPEVVATSGDQPAAIEAASKNIPNQVSPGIEKAVIRELKKAQEYKGGASTLPPTERKSIIKWFPYQLPVFMDRTTGVLVLHWSRQIGKSFTLAAWAVDRLLTRPGRLVTVLSNSKDNGIEFIQKAIEVLNKMGLAYKAHLETQQPEGQTIAWDMEGLEETLKKTIDFQDMRMEVRISIVDPADGIRKTGRIKVLAANPRTARGFSGDLILDEFAFHQDSGKIWDAAEPILSSNPDFLCRIASTGNGKHNAFYLLASGPGPFDGTVFLSRTEYAVSRVSRTEAYRQGRKIYDLRTRKEITPEQGYARALDKRSYRQNYECEFADEQSQLLPHSLISAAEREGVVADEQDWTPSSLHRMYRAEGELFFGVDFGRTKDLTTVWCLEKIGAVKRTIALLRIRGMRFPRQKERLIQAFSMPRFMGASLDATGMGTGPVEDMEEIFGSLIDGVDFRSTEPVTERLLANGTKRLTARVTEIMADNLCAAFESAGSLEIPADPEIREDLCKPERVVSPTGRVSIAAERDGAGHADHFWGLALANRAADRGGNYIPPEYDHESPQSQALEERDERTIC